MVTLSADHPPLRHYRLHLLRTSIDNRNGELWVRCSYAPLQQTSSDALSMFFELIGLVSRILFSFIHCWHDFQVISSDRTKPRLCVWCGKQAPPLAQVSRPLQQPSPANTAGTQQQEKVIIKCSYCDKELPTKEVQNVFNSPMVSGSVFSSSSFNMGPNLGETVLICTINRYNKHYTGYLCGWECFKKWLDEKVLPELVADEFTEVSK